MYSTSHRTFDLPFGRLADRTLRKNLIAAGRTRRSDAQPRGATEPVAQDANNWETLFRYPKLRYLLPLLIAINVVLCALALKWVGPATADVSDIAGGLGIGIFSRR